MRHGSVDERAMITTAVTSSCHWKSLVSFCLRKKRKSNFNINSELSQNDIEKQIMPFKATVK